MTQYDPQPPLEDFPRSLSEMFCGRVVTVHTREVSGPLTPESYAQAFVGLVERVLPWGIVLLHVGERQTETRSLVFIDQIVAIAEVELIPEARGASKIEQP